MRKFVTLLAAAAMAAMPVAAEAAVTANAQSIAAVLTNAGYKAEVTKDDTGDPMIRSAAEGANFIILFFGCSNGQNCKTVQFYAGWNNNGATPLNRINEWNKTKRFGRAYLNDRGNPAIEMDVDLDDGGMSPALFQDNLEFWVALIALFKKHINV